MTAFANARAWSLGATLLAALTGAPAHALPVTPAQQATAQQVAQQGVPLADLSPTAPQQHTVRPGDTLWSLSALFLRQPWRWPALWGMNLEAIANPHRIYPGQVLILDKRDGVARLRMAQAAQGMQDMPTVRLSPRMRSEAVADLAVPALPAHVIEPFLVQPVVADAQSLAQAPRIVAATDERVLLTRSDRAYVRSSAGPRLERASGTPRSWRIFRDAVALKDPDNGEVLGYEAQYLGQAELVEGESSLTVLDARGDTQLRQVPATVDIIDAKGEIRVGDRLLPAPERSYTHYVPHAPNADVAARVVSIYGASAVRYAAQNQVIAINRGSSDGVAEGQVLALVTQGATIQDRSGGQREAMQLPRERNGLAMVFRSFDRVAYALILEVQRGVVVGDYLVAPE